MESKIIQLISLSLQVDKSMINLETGPENFPAWDSIAMLDIITNFENEFDLTLDLEDILSIEKVEDLLHLVTKNTKSSDLELDLGLSGLIKPATIIRGTNSFGELANHIEGETVVILGSKTYSSGFRNKIEDLFKYKIHDILFLNKPSGEPTELHIDELTSKIESTPRNIVGIGGGSVIDTCKLVRTKLNHPKVPLKNWIPRFSLPKEAGEIKLISIPTTHGSGAETSSAAVFNTKKSGKKVILSHDFVSNIVVYDSLFTVGLPKSIAIDTTIDSITHAIEGYISKINMDKTDKHVFESLKTIIRVLDSDIEIKKSESQQELLFASFLSGIVQNHCSVGLTHSISHQLSRYGIPHGRLNAIFLVDVLKYNYSREKSKLDILAENLGYDNGSLLIQWLEEIIRVYEIGSISDYIDNFSSIKFEELIKDIKSDITYTTTPFDISDDELLKILNT
jgi:alcohol dehydrogenase class IV/acyl carrier protein